MKEIKIDELKQILLETLDEIDQFCRRENIKYFLIGGTLLGAIRHKGFIPWDDDIDIGMPRQDYIRFCNTFRSNCCYVLDEKNKDYYLPYAKVINTKGSLHEDIRTKMIIGPYIDIFPFDFISFNKEKKLKKYMERKGLIHTIWKIKHVNFHNTKNKFKKVVFFLVNLFYPFSLNSIAKKNKKKAEQFIEKETGVFCENYGNLFGVWGMKEISKRQYFADTVEVPFEGRSYFAPCGYDEYLKGLYGDYHRLPPKEKRSSHHRYKVWWRE